MLWFDLDNSPHVPLFRPILSELDRRGRTYTVTARDFAQTRELLALWNIPHQLIGGHGGRDRLKKLTNLLQRSGALRNALAGKEIDAAISHGSRTQVVAAWRKRVPAIVMLDYEYTEARIFNTLAKKLLMPAAIPDERLRKAGFNLRKVVRYNGFKEEIYLESFVPQPDFRHEIGIDKNTILISIRPPSTTGNYHDERSERLFRDCLERFSSVPGTHCLVVNRTAAEERLVPPELRNNTKVTLLTKPVDGLQLLWHSDLVLSGGGTMNREAALLGTPTYSIFTGQKPFLDEYLQSQGRLLFIDIPEQIRSIPVVKRDIPSVFTPQQKGMASGVTDLLLDIVNLLQS
jgi:hypothetical protein